MGRQGVSSQARRPGPSAHADFAVQLAEDAGKMPVHSAPKDVWQLAALSPRALWVGCRGT